MPRAKLKDQHDLEILKMRRLSYNGSVKPTAKIQEAKLVERPRYVRSSARNREVGVVQAFQAHF